MTDLLSSLGSIDRVKGKEISMGDLVEVGVGAGLASTKAAQIAGDMRSAVKSAGYLALF